MVIGINIQKSDEQDIYNIQKIVLDKVKKNQYVLNGRTDFLVMTIELLRF